MAMHGCAADGQTGMAGELAFVVRPRALSPAGPRLPAEHERRRSSFVPASLEARLDEIPAQKGLGAP